MPSTDVLRHRLVEELVSDGGLTTPAWKEAFAAVPRHLFLPRFYQQTGDHTGWFPVHRQHPDWLTLIYSNVTLVTQLDNDDQRWTRAVRDGQVTGGVPTSSSTAPGLMALMLEALHVTDRHRVMEIGAGTGYNAALLAHRLGSDQVTTIEFDQGVAKRAKAALSQAGYAPTVITGDGTAGCASRGPYDRVIATVAVPRVPRAWIEQTRPGGIILTNLHRDLGGGALLRMTVDDDGTASGRFLPSYGGFMPVRAHPPADTAKLLATALNGTPGGSGGERRPTALADDHLNEPDFGMFAALISPGVAHIGFHPEGSGYQFWLLATDDAWACLHKDRREVEQGGSRRLWDGLEQAHANWQTWGRPSRERFGVTIQADGTHDLWLDDPARIVAVL